MSTSSAILDSGKVSGQKMSFSQTCNLLSQYVKEKRNLPISSIPTRGVDGFNNRATMNLFPVNEKAVGVESANNGVIGRTINLFPQTTAINSSLSTDPLLMANSCANKSVNTEPSAAQMTIFYGGQVMVFNDLSSDKAKEVMDLASSFEPSPKKRKVETTAHMAPPSPMDIPKSNPVSNPTQNMNVTLSFGQQGGIPASVQCPPVANASDLPIARKASLHRFLEKRKDRLVGKAISDNDGGGAPSKPADGKSWLGLGSLPMFQPQQQL